jgi:hypothetical protein
MPCRCHPLRLWHPRSNHATTNGVFARRNRLRLLARMGNRLEIGVHLAWLAPAEKQKKGQGNYSLP